MQQNCVPWGGQNSTGLSRMHHVQQDSQDVSLSTAEHTGHRDGAHTDTRSTQEGGAGLLSHIPCKPLIYLDWNNLSSAVILTTSVLRSQSGLVLIEAFMSSHKSSKMKTQGPLKYTPRVCAVQLEAFMTPVRAFMTL